ncbi:hypothetical protein BJ742DRAFT_188327 [Cladochytrium replicatum]|nr:hypothetical protein BJ742DRAFT_188327 [Cladochytrium replicatum]
MVIKGDAGYTDTTTCRTSSGDQEFYILRAYPYIYCSFTKGASESVDFNPVYFKGACGTIACSPVKLEASHDNYIFVPVVQVGNFANSTAATTCDLKTKLINVGRFISTCLPQNDTAKFSGLVALSATLDDFTSFPQAEIPAPFLGTGAPILAFPPNATAYWESELNSGVVISENEAKNANGSLPRFYVNKYKPPTNQNDQVNQESGVGVCNRKCSSNFKFRRLFVFPLYYFPSIKVHKPISRYPLAFRSWLTSGTFTVNE